MARTRLLIFFLFWISYQPLVAMDFSFGMPLSTSPKKQLNSSALNLRKAAKVGNVERIIELLAQNKHLDSQGKPDILYMSWALKNAAAKGHASIVKLLLEAGASPDAGGLQSDPTPLMQAVQNMKSPLNFWLHGYREIIELLLKHGADINAQRGDNQEFALYLAIGADSEQLINFLIKRGAQVELQTTNGRTALMNAVQSGKGESAKALLKAGALVNTQTGATNNNEFALYLASQAANDEMVKLLLDNKATMEIATSEGHTPLFNAVIHDRFETVKLLLNRGANPNVNAAEPYRSTPLITAVRQRNFDVMDLLLDAGADAALQDAHGDTALYSAIHHCNQYMVEKLIAIPLKLQQSIRNCFTGLLAINRASKNKLPRDIRRLFANKFIEDYLEEYMLWFTELLTHKNKDQKSSQDLAAERYLGPLAKILCPKKPNGFKKMRKKAKKEISKILFGKPKPKIDRKKRQYYVK